MANSFQVIYPQDRTGTSINTLSFHRCLFCPTTAWQGDIVALVMELPHEIYLGLSAVHTFFSRVSLHSPTLHSWAVSQFSPSSMVPSIAALQTFR